MKPVLHSPAYRDRLTMPKMVISMGNDEFFLPDDSHYYLSTMKGTTYVNMVPNDEHEFRGHELQVFLNIRSFYESIMTVRIYSTNKFDLTIISVCYHLIRVTKRHKCHGFLKAHPLEVPSMLAWIQNL